MLNYPAGVTLLPGEGGYFCDAMDGDDYHEWHCRNEDTRVCRNCGGYFCDDHGKIVHGEFNAVIFLHHSCLDGGECGPFDCLRCDVRFYTPLPDRVVVTEPEYCFNCREILKPLGVLKERK